MTPSFIGIEYLLVFAALCLVNMIYHLHIKFLIVNCTT